jgi:flagellar basal-body rod modification protein FlgD
MAVSIGNVSADGVSETFQSKYTGNKPSATASDDMSTSYLDFNSYLKLLVAQMSNQDFNDPMSDSEFIAQMASYSTLEAIKNMSAQSALQYASSLNGKAVTVSDGTNYEMGIVDSVRTENGKAMLMINGSAYDANSITDVVSDTVYLIMESLKGTEISYDTGLESGKGIVTGGLVASGEQFLIIDGDKLLPLTAITLPSGDNAADVIKDGGNNGTDGANGADGTGGADGTNGADEPAPIDEPPVIDPDPTLNTEPDEALSKESDIAEEEREYEKDELSAPAYSENETLTPLSDIELQSKLSQIAFQRSNLRDTSGGAISLDDYLRGSGQTNTDDDIYDDTDGTGSAVNSTTAATRAVSDAERFTAPYANTIYTNTNPGITSGEGPYYRKYAYEYPAEAALADAYGTRMFDIRHITNTSITSRIDTTRVQGYSASGKAVTEIGFSGKGQLGEINTYADGTQRVEIIFRDGTCGWYITSGRYTIDQITNRKNWIQDLTPAENDIRYYAAEYTAHEISVMDAFEDYVMRTF